MTERKGASREVLIVLTISRRGQNFVGGGFCELEVGNTELAAEVLRVLTRADIFRIEPERDYGPDFCRCMDQARQDLLRDIHQERYALVDWIEEANAPKNIV